MVKTRAAEALIQSQNQNQWLVGDGLVGEISKKAKELSNSRIARQLDRKQSPRKLSAAKEKKKAKRDSLKFRDALSTIKQNLLKAADRNLPDLPDKPPTLFDQIHDPIISGEAKANLKPVVIVIDD